MKDIKPVKAWACFGCTLPCVEIDEDHKDMLVSCCDRDLINHPIIPVIIAPSDEYTVVKKGEWVNIEQVKGVNVCLFLKQVYDDGTESEVEICRVDSEYVLCNDGAVYPRKNSNWSSWRFYSIPITMPEIPDNSEDK